MASSIYTAIEEKGFDNGIVYIMTPNASIIEAHVYNGIIIFCKSLRLSSEQILSVLKSGEIKELTFQKGDIKPEIAQSQVIAQTITGALAAPAKDPARTPLTKLLSAFKLLSSITNKEKLDRTAVFDLVCKQMSVYYRGFLSDVSTLGLRIDTACRELGISKALITSAPPPTDMYSLPEWVFNNFSALPNGPMKDMLLYYIFFGEMPRSVIRTTIEKNASLGAKQGYVVLSKTVYPAFQTHSTAAVFRGMQSLGDISISWHTDKKNAALFTKTDMDRLGLNNEETISLIF